jgi:serine/threonine-protein kinase RsbW
MPLLNAESSAGKLAFSREVTFAGDTEAMFAARDEIMQFLNAHGVDGEVEIDMLVALQEALANAVVHGCGNDSAKTVHCTVEVDSSEINLVVRDPGAGFDAYSDGELEDGTNLTNHGRGILLMRSLMDEVSYRHHGSEVHLKKFRRRSD